MESRGCEVSRRGGGSRCWGHFLRRRRRTRSCWMPIGACSARGSGTGRAEPHLRDILGTVPLVAAERPRTETTGDLSEYLRAEVARLVGFPAEQVELDTGLNELGMDSLMAVRLRNRLKADRNLEIPIVTLMENPSIRVLAASMDGKAAAAIVEGVI